LPSLHHKGLACSPGGRWLAATVGNERTVPYLWDVKAERGRELTPATEGGVRSVAFSPDGRVLAASWAEARTQGGVTFWALPAGREIGSLWFHPLPAWRLAFSPDGQTLAASDVEGGIRLLPWRRLLA
jgi:WD40 repeat protein